MFGVNLKFLRLSYFEKIGGTGRTDGRRLQHLLRSTTDWRAA